MLIEAAALFTPHVIFAMTGGAVGAMFGIAKNNHGVLLSTILMLVGVMVASAVGDYLHQKEVVSSVFAIGGIGIPVGLLSGFLIDALEVASPRLAQKVVSKFDNKIDKF